MNTNKFLGVAYWTVTTAVSDWLKQAAEVLAVLQTAGLADVKFESTPVGNQMTVGFGSDQYLMMVNNGTGTGKVHECPSSGCFVVCLVALRKALGDLNVVTESQQHVATRPRQTDSLYSSDWLRISKIAQELRLIGGDALLARFPHQLANMF